MEIKTLHDIPIFNAVLKEDNEGLLLVSFVEDPAVEVDFLKFEKENIQFTRTNEEQKIVTGVAMLADTPLYRMSSTIGEYYVQFSKETLKELVLQWFAQGKQNITNLQHKSSTISEKECTLIESYFVDKDRGINPIEFNDKLPDGTWIVSYKIINDELWEAIKKTDSIFKGFSIEVHVDVEPALKDSDEEPDGEQDAVDYINSRSNA